jgi:ribonuclease P protein subunit POP4
LPIKDVQNIIENLVHPREKKTDNIQNIHQYQEIQNEKQKTNKKVKQTKKQNKRLSRQQMKDMGMFSLPRKTLKYDDYQELNNIWNGYMESQLGTNVEELKNKFEVTSSQYEMVSGLIHKSDLHGAKIKVIQSKCVSLVGQKGIVLMDTKGTFNIICKDNVLRSELMIVLKKNV